MGQDLERRAAAVLAQSSVLAEVSAGQVEWQTRGSGDRTARPAGSSSSLHDLVAARLARCATEQDLVVALAWAEGAVEATRRSKPQPQIPFRVRLLTEWEGHHYRAVARTTSTPSSTVRRWREEDGRDPLYGRRRSVPASPV